VLLVSHDAGRTGAPIVLAHLARWLAADGGLRLTTLLPGRGPLSPAFAACGPVVHLDRSPPAVARTLGRAGRLVRWPTGYAALFENPAAARRAVADADLVYLNSLAAAPLLRRLGRPAAPVVTHVHELAGAIRRYTTPDDMAFIKAVTARFVAASEPVADNLIRSERVSADWVEVIPECVDPPAADGSAEDARRTVRADFGLPADARLVVGCGVAQHRKGTDLFVRAAAELARLAPDVPATFVWVGRWESRAYRRETLRLVRELGLPAGAVRFVGERADPRPMFRGGDVFLLTSREDPFPLVALEAAAAGLPVLSFAGTGGIPQAFGQVVDVAVPALDSAALAARTAALLRDEGERQTVGRRLDALVRREYVVSACGPRVLGVVREVLAAAAGRGGVS
jgi:glycosyltransferase involved in cell wall biosynthesis